MSGRGYESKCVRGKYEFCLVWDIRPRGQGGGLALGERRNAMRLELKSVSLWFKNHSRTEEARSPTPRKVVLNSD